MQNISELMNISSEGEGGGSLQYLVDKVVHFHTRTLPFAKLAGPFTEDQLGRMFAEAHFCADLTLNPAVSENYSPVVRDIRDKYVLELAPETLLMSLADNLKVNKDSLIRARNLFDRDGEDLESSLVLMRRHLVRDKFLEISQKLKNSSPEGWKSLRDYMRFVDLQKRGEVSEEKMKKFDPETILKFLLLEDPCFKQLQETITTNWTLSTEQLLDTSPELTAALLKLNPVFRGLLETQLLSYLNRTDVDIFALEKVSHFLCGITQNCDSDILQSFMEKIENNINIVFVKEELINFMTVKMKLMN